MILSVAAIGISIYVMNKQNKIALFDKRYELYQEIKKFTILQCGIELAIIEKEK